MFNKIPMAEGSEELIYQDCFGNLPNKTVYHDPLHGIDAIAQINESAVEGAECKSAIVNEIRRNMELKAEVTTTSPTMTVGTSFGTTTGTIPVNFPSWPDPQVYDVTRRRTPLAAGLIPRVTNRGLFADYIKLTTLPASYWRPEDASATTTKTTETRTVAKIKYMYSNGRVTGPARIGSLVWNDIFTRQVNAHTISIKELEEDTIINGDTTAATYADGFNGFATSVTTNTDDHTSNAELSLDDIDAGLRKIRDAKGAASFAVTDYKTFYHVRALLRPFMQIGGNTNTLGFSDDEITYNGLRIIPDLFMPTTVNTREFHIWSTENCGSGGPCVQMRVLQEPVYEELAKTNDSMKFMIKQYLTMIFVHEAWCHRIYELP